MVWHHELIRQILAGLDTRPLRTLVVTGVSPSTVYFQFPRGFAMVTRTTNVYFQTGGGYAFYFALHDGTANRTIRTGEFEDSARCRADMTALFRRCASQSS